MLTAICLSLSSFAFVPATLSPGTMPSSASVTVESRTLRVERALPFLRVANRAASIDQHDREIDSLLKSYNANKKAFASVHGRANHSALPDLGSRDAFLVLKAWALTESAGKLTSKQATVGGSRAGYAWKHDPMQVNNFGDWTQKKSKAGLSKPKRRGLVNRRKTHYNADMTPKTSFRAALKWLIYKGQKFDKSGRGTWQGFEFALKRYNGGGDSRYLEKVRHNLSVLLERERRTQFAFVGPVQPQPKATDVLASLGRPVKRSLRPAAPVIAGLARRGFAPELAMR